jgi:hypothetical protein
MIIMDKIHTIIQHFKHVFAQPKQLKKESLYPERDWKLLLVLSAVLLVLAAFYSVYLYKQVAAGDAFAPQETVTPVVLETIDREALERAVKYYEDKDERFAKLKVTRPAFVDPSI